MNRFNISGGKDFLYRRQRVLTLEENSDKFY